MSLSMAMASRIRFILGCRQLSTLPTYLKIGKVYTNYEAICLASSSFGLYANQRSFSTNVLWQQYKGDSKRKIYAEFDLPQRGADEGQILEIVRMHYTETGITKDDPVVQRLFTGIKEGKRAALAESITLVESTHPKKKAQAQVLLTELLEDAHKSRRRSIKGISSFRIGN